MAREDKVQQFAQQAGYTPLKDRCIIVKYALEHLREKIASFFSAEKLAQRESG